MQEILASAPLVHLGLLSAIVAVGITLTLLFEYSCLAPFFNSLKGVSNSFHNAPTLIFALFFGYLITGITHDRVSARMAVAAEAGAITSLADAGRFLGKQGDEFRMRLAGYVRLATDDAWQAPANYRAAAGAMSRLQWDVLHGLIPAEEVELRQLISSRLNEASTAHRQLFLLSDYRPTKRKWLAALILGFFAQVALAAVHIGQPRASMLASVIMGLSLGLALSVMASLVDPFKGGIPANMALIAEALE